MIVPVPWFVFFDSLDIRIERTGSFENALVELRESLPESGQAELRSFFETASRADSDECSVLTSLELDKELFVESDEPCAQFYSRVLKIFNG